MRKKLLLAAFLCVFLVPVRLVFAQPYAATTVMPANPRPPVTSPVAPERFQGKTLLLLAYSIDNPRAGEAVEFLQDISKIKNEFNFEVIGVNINADREDAVRQFNQQHGATFPLMFDKTGELAKSIKLTGDLSLYAFNKKSDLMGVVPAVSIPNQKNLGQAFRVYADKVLKLGFIPVDEPVLGDRPPVPFFEAEALDGKKINLKLLYEQKPLILIFFSPACSHCRDELMFLKDLLINSEFKNKFSIIAVSRHNKEVTEKFVKEQGLTFPVLLDTGNVISGLFESFVGTVPLAYIVNKSGRICSKHLGFSDRVRDIYLMELRTLFAMPNKPLLLPSGYSGHDRCQVCHEKQYVQWSLTKHSNSFTSLKRKGKEDDPACVSCHVTGWNQPNGYKIDDKSESRMLEGVQCEVCHGPGYQSCSAFTGVKLKKKSADEWKSLCLSCHTGKESLNFNFTRRFPKVLHGTVPDLSKMTRGERVKLLREHTTKNDLFGNPASYAGAESCKKCHEQEYTQWSATPHASAYQSSAAQSAHEEKKHRFTTGFGSAGGYPAAGRQGVQCEACHGPGERHIKEPNKKGQEYIVALGGQCDSCVVEQICRTCHGPEDDPNFNFEQYREKIRHKPKP